MVVVTPASFDLISKQVRNHDNLQAFLLLTRGHSTPSLKHFVIFTSPCTPLYGSQQPVTTSSQYYRGFTLVAPCYTRRFSPAAVFPISDVVSSTPSFKFHFELPLPRPQYG